MYFVGALFSMFLFVCFVLASLCLCFVRMSSHSELRGFVFFSRLAECFDLDSALSRQSLFFIINMQLDLKKISIRRPGRK